MNQEIEIEFKTLLTPATFERLQQALSFPNKAITQINYYFETEKFALKEKRSALRIREKNGGYTLTLKQPHPQGILETHDNLTPEEFEAWIQGHPKGEESTNKQLKQMGVSVNDLAYYGSLKTERYSFEKDGIIYVLDKSFYHNVVDYELEIEAPDYGSGEKAFINLLNEFSIVKQAPITKIERFFTASRKI